MKRKLTGRIALLALCLGLVQCTSKTTVTDGPPTAFAVMRLTTDGVLDPNFGMLQSGIAVTDIDPPALDFALAVAIQADGKIVTAGSDGLGGQGQVALVRYTTSGTPDTGFGSGGIVKTPLASPALASAVALQPADSKIVVAALMVTPDSTSSTGLKTSVTLLRYNPDGSPDTGFASPASVNFAIGSGTAGDICALVLQPDGKIVVTGAAQDGKLVLYRYDPVAAALDTAFGDAATPGKTVTQLAASGSDPKDRPVAMALQSSGKIIVATRNNNDEVVLRYNTDGTLDTTFGLPSSPGMISTDFFNAVNYANALAVQSADDKIVVAGHAFINGDVDITVVKYTANGAPDPTFNGTGKLSDNLGFTDNAFAVLLQTQPSTESKIVVTGNFGLNGFSNTFLRRYKPDGSLDTTFATQGHITVPRLGPANIASGGAIVTQAAGNAIVVAGYD